VTDKGTPTPPRAKVERRSARRRLSRMRAFVRYYLVGIDTLSGRVFDLLVIAMIILGVAALILESMPDVEKAYSGELRLVEQMVGIVFIVEYLARLWVARRWYKYAFSFWGIVDALAIAPFVFQGFGFAALRALRVLRVFSILKVVEYTSASEGLAASLIASRKKIFVFLLSVTVLVLVLAFAMHLVEPESFPTVPDAIWWTIVTITTVGYGDMVPQTLLGKFIAAITMMTAFGIIAVPTGVISVEYQKSMRALDARVCRRCKKDQHEEDANYCSRCGEELPATAE